MIQNSRHRAVIYLVLRCRNSNADATTVCWSATYGVAACEKLRTEPWACPIPQRSSSSCNANEHHRLD